MNSRIKTGKAADSEILGVANEISYKAFLKHGSIPTAWKFMQILKPKTLNLKKKYPRKPRPLSPFMLAKSKLIKIRKKTMLSMKFW